MFELPVEITQDMLDIQRQKLLSVIKDHGNSVEKGGSQSCTGILETSIHPHDHI